MRSFLATILTLWQVLCLHAQQGSDTLQVIDLKAVTISAATTLSKSFYDIDTLTANSVGVSNSLQQYSNFYINTSSPNGLTTLSLAGIPAKSIPVVWQNHNLNSVMNGVMDIQLLDNFLFNHLEIKYSDSFEQAGWGGCAASISIGDYPDSRIHIQHQLGSFGKQKIGLAHSWNSKLLNNYTKAFYLKAENDFKILHPQVNNEKQTNNAIKSWGILNNSKFVFKENHNFNINIWWQNTHREIATPLFTSKDESSQIDSTLRVNLAWQYQPLNLEASIAYFNELNAYYNPKIEITGIHKTIALKSYVTHHKRINKAFTLSNSISYNFYKATSTNFDNQQFRNSAQLKSVLFYQLENIPLKFKTDVVVDFTDNELLPIRPGIYAAYDFNDKLKAGAQLSRHYSLPTFNDLYWVPGGNNELFPESGYVANLHLSYNYGNTLIKLNLFNSNINNEIVWQPKPGHSFWSPENVNKLNSKGFSIKAQQLFNFNQKNKLDVICNYIYLIAQNVKANPEINFQLIYRPKHKGSIDLSYFFDEKIRFNYSHQITSKRFTTTNNSEFVPAFNTANFSVQYQTNIDQTKLNIEISMLNLFNTYYEVTANRPMPGTHFLITTNFNF